MPSTMTHSYFAYDVYDKLSDKSKISDIENFKLYSQGTDPFMFYNFLLGKKSKYFAKVQSRIHKTKTRDFFLNIMEYIIDNNLINNKDIVTFLYGNICHYFLDLWVHPLIYYKTGRFNRTDKTTYKYNALHQDMEFMIDRYLILKREKIVPRRFKIHKEIFNNYKIDDEVIKCLDYAVSKTYEIDNIGKSYKKSVRMMKQFFYLFNYDRFGVKRKIYLLVDKITPPNVIKISELSYANENINDNYLNLDHNLWHHPAIEKEVYYDSFLDLYDKALNDTLDAINVVNDFLNKKIIDNKKLDKTFNNLSYVTGKNYKLELKMKYFEF